MKPSEQIHFKILRAIESKPEITQRELANKEILQKFVIPVQAGKRAAFGEFRGTAFSLLI